jgi:hypothetical protein
MKAKTATTPATANYAKATAFVNLKVHGTEELSFKNGLAFFAGRKMDDYFMANPDKIQELFSDKVTATLVFANGSKESDTEFSL